jgi:alkylation response protein AidB-like acyl-CoA dehydrogenase
MTSHEDLVEFGDWVGEAMDRIGPLDRTLPLVQSGRSDDTVWSELAASGLVGAFVPEEYGGLGGTPSMAGVALARTGQVLLPVGYASTAVVATHILRMLPDSPIVADLFERINAGSLRLSWANGDTNARRDDESGMTLSGDAGRVVDADVADALLVGSSIDGERVIVLVDAAQEGVQVDGRPPLDLTRPALHVTFTGARATPLEAPNVLEIVEQADLLQRFAIASEAAGEAQATLEMSVGYAMDRQQFGRPIGAFQAIKHTCADMFVAAQGALAGGRLLCERWQATGLVPSLETLAVADYALSAALTNATKNTQIHGGIALTWEHRAHWFVKRAKSSQLTVGGDQGARIAERILDTRTDITAVLFHA